MGYRIACRYQDSTEIDDAYYPDMESARRRAEEMKGNPLVYGTPQIVEAMTPTGLGAGRQPATNLDGVLPPGYRMQLRWVFLPIEIAGRYHRMETVRVVQRYMGNTAQIDMDDYWHDVGFWDEVYPAIVKSPGDFAEL